MAAAASLATPSFLGKSALGLQATGAVSSIFGAYGKSQAEQAAYQYQANVAKNNAISAEWQAQDAIIRGQAAEAQQRLKTAQLKGTQRASLAARGIDLGEGSALNILTDTDYMGELDALTIRNNAAREAWAMRERAKGYSSESQLLGMRAEAVSPGGAAFGSLLTGAAGVASSWYGMSKAGIFK